MNCTFCDAASDDLLIDSRDGGAILADRAPLAYGHMLVASSRHVPSLLELSREERWQLIDRVRFAQEIAAGLTGRAAIAIEHGRSPTCGDPSGSQHAHVHVFPVGEFDAEGLDGWDSVSPIVEPGSGSYLAVLDDKTTFLRPRLGLQHAARSLAAMVASQNGVGWRPLTAPPDHSVARETASAARAGLAMTRTSLRGSAPRGLAPEQVLIAGDRPVVTISGPTGAGKTSVGAVLTRKLNVPAIELGVIVRLAAYSARPDSDGSLAALLWQWHRTGRLDFDGASTAGLTATVPRLDGRTAEQTLWTNAEIDRITELARGAQSQEVLMAIASRVASHKGAIIIGRVPPQVTDLAVTRLQLDAALTERVRRKRRQLAVIGLTSADHDWFLPRSREAHRQAVPPIVVDTTHLSVQGVLRAVLPHAAPMAGNRWLCAAQSG